MDGGVIATSTTGSSGGNGSSTTPPPDRRYIASEALNIAGAYTSGVFGAIERAAGATTAGKAMKLSGLLHDAVFSYGNYGVSGNLGSTLASTAGGIAVGAAVGALLPAATGVVATMGLIAAGSYIGGKIGEALYDYAEQNGVINDVSRFSNDVYDAISNAASQVADAVSNGLNDAAAAAQQFYDSAKQWLSDAIDTATDPAFYEGLMDTLQDAASGLMDWLGDKMDAIGDALDDLFGPDDPSSPDDPAPGDPNDPNNPGDPNDPNNPDAPQGTGPHIPGAADGMGDAGGMISPLVLDLDGDGIELTWLSQSGAFFDLDGDGFAERTGWVGPDDGLLALDRNGNGEIDDIGELFGSATTNGFVFLNALDDNVDGVIDAGDVSFSLLRVWRDSNQDGVSQSWELKSLADLGIASLSLASVSVDQMLAGNRISDISTYTRTDGSTAALVDAWFANDQINTKSTTDYELNPDTLFLAKLRGYGTVENLHIAMSRDTVLLDMVKDLAMTGIADASTFDEQVEAIMLRWAGVDGIDPASRGAYVDARHLAFLERYFDRPFVQNGVGPDPRWNAGAKLEETWDTVFQEAKARLLVQGPLAALMPGVSYNLHTDRLGGSYIDDVITAAAAAAPPDDGGTTLLRHWAALVPVFDVLNRYLPSPNGYEAILAAAIQGSGLATPLAELRSLASTMLTGTAGADTLVGTKAADFLDGGAGNDLLKGGENNDLYFFGRGYGADRVHDDGNTRGDVVQFGSGIAQGDIELSRAGANLDDLVLTIRGTGDSITVVDNFHSERTRVEEIRFDDNSLWSYDEVKARLLAQASTEGDDTIIGFRENDHLAGGAGNDLLQGRQGNDVLDGGTGNDRLEGGEGSDTYVFDRGHGQDRVLDWYNYSSNNTDAVSFGPGIAPGDLVLARDGVNLVITVSGTTDTLTIERQFDGTGYRIEEFRFADGTRWTWSQVQARLLEEARTEGDDTIHGFITNDVLDGGAGNDRLEGGEGSDVYVFDRGYGQDRVLDWYNYSSNNTDAVSFGPGVAQSDLILSRAGTNLVISIAGTTDTLTIERQFDGSSYRIEEFRFADGTKWSWSEVQVRLLQAAMTEGDDIIHGFLTNDTILGGAGNDTLIDGASGNDVLDGGTGNDRLEGGEGSDTYVFDRGYGQDRVLDWYNYSNNHTDAVSFGPGIAPGDLALTRDGTNLVISVAGTDDSLTIERMFDGTGYRIEEFRFADGTKWTWDQVQVRLLQEAMTEGDDTIRGFHSNDTILGGAGNDTLIDGGSGNDILDGGSGNDRLEGGEGSDTYVFGRGYGQDRVLDWYNYSNSHTDVVSFGPDVAPGDLVLSRAGASGFDLVISIAGTTDTLTIERQFDGVGYRIEEFRFADGTRWTWDQVWNRVLQEQGNAGDNTITGGSGNDVLDGGAGNDYLQGGAGSDTYIFDRGYGQDRVLDWYNYSNNHTDAVSFGPNVEPSELVLARNGNNLVITIAGTTDSLTIERMFDGTGYRIEEFCFTDGTKWTWSQVQTRLLEEARTEGDDTIHGFITNDVLDGGAGNDRLEGGEGSDVYVFDRGHGQDRVLDWYNYSNNHTDAVSFGPGVVQDDLVLSRAGTNLVISIAGTTDTLTIERQFDGTGYRIEEFRFADGTKWTWDQVQALMLQRAKTAGDDTIIGFQGADILDGGAGNDRLEGGEGSDVYVFDRGYGQDRVLDWYNYSNNHTDAVGFGPGIAPGDLVLSRTGTNGINLEIAIAGTMDTLTIERHFDGTGYRIEEFRFADGTKWTWSQVQAMVLAGTSASQTIWGFDSADTIDAGDGDDVVHGLAGNDTLNGGAGNDRLEGGDGDDMLIGGDGDDVLIGGAGADTYDGGAGIDTADYSSSSSHWTLDLVAGTATNPSWTGVEHFTGIENLTGGSGRDTLIGDAQANRLLGMGGNDTINGGAGDDFLDGGDGDDILRGGDGDDVLSGGVGLDLFDGGAGNDTADFSYSTANWELDLAAGTTWGGTGSKEQLISIENLTGGGGNDRLTGDAGVNRLDGGAGNDTLSGGAGDDLLIGGTGSDTYLFGRGGGQDTVDNQASDAASADDRVLFGADIAHDQLWLTRSDDDLVLDVVGTADRVTIQGWYASPEARVDGFRAGDGRILAEAQVDALVAAMAAFDPPAGTDAHLPTDTRAALNADLAAAWQPST